MKGRMGSGDFGSAKIGAIPTEDFKTTMFLKVSLIVKFVVFVAFGILSYSRTPFEVGQEYRVGVADSVSPRFLQTKRTECAFRRRRTRCTSLRTVLCP